MSNKEVVRGRNLKVEDSHETDHRRSYYMSRVEIRYYLDFLPVSIKKKEKNQERCTSQWSRGKNSYRIVTSRETVFLGPF